MCQTLAPTFADMAVAGSAGVAAVAVDVMITGMAAAGRRPPPGRTVAATAVSARAVRTPSPLKTRAVNAVNAVCVGSESPETTFTGNADSVLVVARR